MVFVRRSLSSSEILRFFRLTAVDTTGEEPSRKKHDTVGEAAGEQYAVAHEKHVCGVVNAVSIPLVVPLPLRLMVLGTDTGVGAMNADDTAHMAIAINP